MSAVLVRVDNRLIHGQIVTAWVPALAIDRILVVDDEVLGDELEQALMRSAVPPGLDLEICGSGEASNHASREDGHRVLVLFRSVAMALAAWSGGFRFERLNLGNCHAGDARCRCTDSVYLDDSEMQSLRELARVGVKIVCQALPTEAPHQICQEVESSEGGMA